MLSSSPITNHLVLECLMSLLDTEPTNSDYKQTQDDIYGPQSTFITTYDGPTCFDAGICI